MNGCIMLVRWTMCLLHKYCGKIRREDASEETRGYFASYMWSTWQKCRPKWSVDLQRRA